VVKHLSGAKAEKADHRLSVVLGIALSVGLFILSSGTPDPRETYRVRWFGIQLVGVLWIVLFIATCGRNKGQDTGG
jgi:hypothetical protein